MPDISTLPAEIWREIVLYACTDGGFTGTSLALTSKFLRTQSHNLRFHSLALSSLLQLERFVACLQLRLPGSKPRIEHLYLSFYNVPAILRSQQQYRPPKLRRRNEFNVWTRELQKKWDDRLTAAWTTLAALAAPTLRTLCIVEEGVLLRLEFHCDFPVLEELCWRGGLCPLLRSGLGDPGASLDRLPALKRVHFATSANVPVLATLAAKVPSPSITHLRISEVTGKAWDLPLVLARAVGLPPPPQPDDGEPSEHAEVRDGREAGLPRLRSVVIYAEPPDPWAPCLISSYRDPWETVCDDLNILARACERRPERPRIHVLVRKGSRDPRWCERMRNDWLDRLQGGRGCWVETEEDPVLEETYLDSDEDCSDEEEFF